MITVYSNLTFVLRSIKRRCHGNQFSMGKIANTDITAPSFFVLAFRHELEYRNADRNVNSGDDILSTPCRNMVSFGRVTRAITRLECVTFATNRQKCGISQEVPSTFARVKHRH